MCAAAFVRFLGDFAIYMNSQRGEDGVEVAAVLEGFERKAIHRRWSLPIVAWDGMGLEKVGDG